MSEPWKDLDQEDQKDQQERLNDGLPQDDRDEAHETVIDAEPAELPAKKKGPNPRIVAGVMGIACLGALGFFGMSLKDKLMPSQERTVAKSVDIGTTLASSSPASVEPVAIGTGTAIMGDGSDPKAVAAAAVQVEADASAASAAAAQPSVVAVAPVTAVAEPAPEPTKPGSDRRVVELNAKVKDMQVTIDKMAAKAAAERQRAAQSGPVRHGEVPAERDLPAGTIVTQPAQVATGPIVGSPVGGPGSAGSTSTKHRSRPNGNKGSDVVITEAKVEEVPPEIKRLQLRGVYPPLGADMQAWVVDGSKTIVVAKGDLINGARVLRVEPDRVVTAAGTIR